MAIVSRRSMVSNRGPTIRERNEIKAKEAAQEEKRIIEQLKHEMSPSEYRALMREKAVEEEIMQRKAVIEDVKRPVVREGVTKTSLERDYEIERGSVNRSDARIVQSKITVNKEPVKKEKMGIFPKHTVMGRFGTWLKKNAAPIAGGFVAGAATALGAGKIVDMVRAARANKKIREDKIVKTLQKQGIPATKEAVKDVERAIKKGTGELPVIPVDADSGSGQEFFAKAKSFVKKHWYVLLIVPAIFIVIINYMRPKRKRWF